MKRGKILKVKFGFNPNSSSLGIPIIFVLMGSFLAYGTIALVSSIIRARRRLGAGEPDGEKQ